MGQYQLCQAWVGFAPVDCQIAARDTIQFVKQGKYLQVYFFSILSIGDLMVEGQEKLMQMFYVGNRGVGNLRLIGLVGLGPASRVFTFHLLDSLLTATTNISMCPHMTSYSNILHHS